MYPTGPRNPGRGYAQQNASHLQNWLQQSLPPKQNHRIFYPENMVANTNINPLHSPSRLITSDLKLGISHLIRGLQNMNHQTATECDPKSLVLKIDGACPGNGTSAARSAYGIYFGRDSYLNTFGIVPVTEDIRRPTNNSAELYAVIQALKLVSRLCITRDIATVVVITDSTYVVDGISDWIVDWLANGFKDSKKQRVKNAALFKTLHDRILFLATIRVDVKFWRLPREQNKEANALANRALSMTHIEAERNRLRLYKTPTVKYWMEHGTRAAARLSAFTGISLGRSYITNIPSKFQADIMFLVVIGADTPTNLKAFFGPTWDNAKEEVKPIWVMTRMIFLARNLESPHLMSAPINKNFWTPRPFSGQEHDQLLDLQKRLKEDDPRFVGFFAEVYDLMIEASKCDTCPGNFDLCGVIC
ncbi:hypothetical protein B7494_g833 [Chlorociboria aeruginascens]|nr:hypothetical protein B7494_g833 [Chlorociboria aeruginascens]